MALAASRTPARTLLPGDLPVRSVTVFSDQARVIRSGELRIQTGIQQFELTRLPQTVVPDSVRVEATGAKVSHVEVHPVRLGELPKTEAEALIDRLTHLNDDVNTLQDQLAAINEERTFLDSIHPYAEPLPREGVPAQLLNPTGWSTSLGFFSTRTAALATSEGEVNEKLRLKQEEIAHVQAQAQQLLGASGSGPGYIVTATLEGKDASARVSLTYLARGARWYPSYDVHYTPGQKNVEIGFSGLVSQETGEDWSDARLTLSTAVPTTVTALPQLAVWKLGDRERFIPTPHPGPQEGAPPMRPRPPPVVPMAQEDDVRSRLMAALAVESPPPEAPAPPPPRMKRGVSPMPGYRPQSYAPTTPAPTAAPMAAPTSIGGEADMEYAATVQSESSMRERRSVSLDSEEVSGRISSGPAPTYLSFSSPVGWAPTPLPGDLPASLAGGYDFAYDSARPESITSGAEARRIPLFSGEYPAEAWINILPALSHSAYLVAEVTNTGNTPWLRGQAHLFVGSDLVGDAVVPTTAPAEKVTLPLGIDDAIRVERNVQTVSSERGLFARLDVGAYETTIELLNTRTTPVPVRVKDQVPLSRQQEVVVAIGKMDPATFKADKELKEDGTLEWRLTLAGGAKQVIKFQYDVARPKNWKLYQTSAPGVSR